MSTGQRALNWLAAFGDRGTSYLTLADCADSGGLRKMVKPISDETEVFGSGDLSLNSGGCRGEKGGFPPAREWRISADCTDIRRLRQEVGSGDFFGLAGFAGLQGNDFSGGFCFFFL